jgi:branched-chain amino acid transport system permease protein
MLDSFSYFVNQLISGVSLGAIYGLIALGYTMVYGIIGMINFAHGEVFMIGAFVSLIAYLLMGLLGLGWVPLAIFAMLVLAMTVNVFYGWTLERVAYRPLRGSPRLAPLITAIGMSIFLQNYVQLLQGARPRPLQPLLPGALELWVVQAPGGGDYAVQVSFLQLFIILATVGLMLAFTYLITRTPLGRAQRACEQDRRMAALIGINVDRTIAITFIIGALLAAVAGLIFALRYGSVDFFIGFLAGVKAFTAAVLGGIGSLPGAMIGGLLIGLIEAFFAGYINTEWKDVAVFSILVIVLIFRPSGLLGRPDIEKV